MMIPQKFLAQLKIVKSTDPKGHGRLLTQGRHIIKIPVRAARRSAEHRQKRGARRRSDEDSRALGRVAHNNHILCPFWIVFTKPATIIP